MCILYFGPLLETLPAVRERRRERAGVEGNELSLLFEIQDLDNGECCLSCREGTAEWLRFIRFRLLLPLARKKTGNKSERISIQISFVCLCSTRRSSCSKVDGRAAESLKEKLASSLQWTLGWGNFEMRGRQTKWTGDGRPAGGRASSITGG